MLQQQVLGLPAASTSHNMVSVDQLSLSTTLILFTVSGEQLLSDLKLENGIFLWKKKTEERDSHKEAVTAGGKFSSGSINVL